MNAENKKFASTIVTSSTSRRSAEQSNAQSLTINKLIGIVFVAFVVTSFVSVWAGVGASVHAAKSELLSFGNGLAELFDRGELPNALHFNGATIDVRVTSNTDGINANLDSLSKWCEDGIPSFVPSILRERSEHRGFVACFKQKGSLSLIERAQKFTESTDLAAWGHGYVFIVEDGDVSTRVVSLAFEDSFPLAEMFPAEGDAPGADAFDLRPNNARRLFSVHTSSETAINQQVGGDLVASYQLEETAIGETISEAAASYQSELAAKGWQILSGSIVGADEEAYEWTLRRTDSGDDFAGALSPGSKSQFAFASIQQDDGLKIVTIAALSALPNK